MKYIAGILLLAGAADCFAPVSVDTRVSTILRNDLWDGEEGDSKPEMSKALPFVARPKILDGTLAGDVGFE